MERCEELKVPRGTRFSWLKEGKSVLNEMGEVIHPDQVIILFPSSLDFLHPCAPHLRARCLG